MRFCDMFYLFVVYLVVIIVCYQLKIYLILLVIVVVPNIVRFNILNTQKNTRINSSVLTIKKH